MSETYSTILYERPVEGVARVVMNRPDARNAQNLDMTYELNDAFDRAVADAEVRVIILAGADPHFSSGHDLRDSGDKKLGRDFPVVSTWGGFEDAGAEGRYAREQEIYLQNTRRWRNLSKPTIAQVQGKCLAGGLMLAWACDLIVASDDAYFQDPVLRMGIPGVEYFAHVHELNPRIAREFLYLGERMGAERAQQLGMVNKVVPRDELEAAVQAWAVKIAAQPRLGLSLTKTVINRIEELQGLRSAMDLAYGYHHFAHAHSQVLGAGHLGGQDAKSMVQGNRRSGEG